MLPEIGILWRLFTQFRHYEPQPVTLKSSWQWLRQFPRDLRRDIFGLLQQVIFISKEQTHQYLSQGNAKIIALLEADGLGPEHIIYVEIDKPGSSSGVMLNEVRNRQNMELRGSKFIFARDGDLMAQYTTDLGSGAIVYVDDFSGSGRQFMYDNRNVIAPFINGNFSEFFLVACICEEGKERVESEGVIPMAGVIHLKRDRPLHSSSNILAESVKERLIDLSDKMYPPVGLGFDQMAVMVILARNAPDNVPAFLRGSPQQTPFRGIFPRWDDLRIQTLINGES
jgi:hypothetical protein